MLKTVGSLLRDPVADKTGYLLRRGPAIRGLNIEIAYACNMACLTCTRTCNTRAAYMDTALFAQIIEELAGAGYRGGLYLHYAGEPLLHPELDDLLGCIRKQGWSDRVVFYSNGLGLSAEKVAVLHRNGIRNVTVSIDGDSDYQSSRRKPGSYEPIIANLARIRQNYENEMKLTVHTTLFDQTEEQLQALMRDVEPHIDMLRIAPSLDQETMTWNPHARFTPPRYSLQARTCPCIFSSPVILTDGRIQACCFELAANRIVPGVNARDGLCEAFLGESYSAVRSDMCEKRFEGAFAGCAKCSAWKAGSYNTFRLRVKKLGRVTVVNNGYTTRYQYSR